MKDILKQIQSLKEDFMNLIEVEGLGQPASDVPPSTNKIKKDRKTKNGKVELVSVEDELFPYDGNKREQYRQKIIDTINGMIQGTATLEDLLQIVREKKMPVKEGCEVALNRLHVERDKEAEGMPSRSKEMYELNKKYKKLEKKVKKHYSKSLEEAMEVLESLEGQRTKDGKLIKVPKKITRNIKGEWKTRDRRYTEPNDKGEQYLKAPYYTDKVYVPKSDDQKVQDSIARHERKKQKKAPLEEAMEVLERISDKNVEKVIGAWNAEYLKQNMPSKTRKEFEEKVREKTKKKAPLKEALQLLESIISEAKPKDPEGYKKNIDIANHYDHLYSISPAKAPDGSPNSVAAEWNRRYQHYFNKAMKCYYGDGSKKKDSIKEALSLIESIHTAIEKGAHEIKKPMLHAKAIINYSNELQNAAKKELPKNKKNSFKAINDKMNEIAKKRGISPADDYVNGNKPEEA